MNMHLIAVHVDMNEQPIGFRILDSDSGQVANYTYEQVLPVIMSNKATIHGIEYDNISKSLKGSNGTFQRYTNIFNGKNKNNSMVILGAIEDIGYRVSNFEGKIVDAYTKDVLEFAVKVGIANGKVVDKESKFISAISGTYDNIDLDKSTLKRKIVATQQNKKLEEAKKQLVVNKSNYSDLDSSLYRPNIVRQVSEGESGLELLDEKCGMTVNQKIAFTVKALKYTKPFYYSVYRCIKLVEANPLTVDTMGVSLDTLYFNSKFVQELTMEELMFVFVHELNHLLMKHRARAKHRNHEIWNCACDYYINKSIMEEYGIKNIGDMVGIQTIQYVTSKFAIQAPKDMLYNENIDLHKDTPELIYEELYKQINKDNQQGQGQGQGQGQQGQGQEGQGQGQGQQGQGQEGQGQGQGQQGQGQEGQGQEGQEGENAQGQNQQGQSTDTQGNKQGQQDNNAGKKLNGQCVGKESQLAGKTFRGKVIENTNIDIVDDEKSVGESQENLEQKGDALLRRIVTVHKQSTGFGKDIPDWIERYVENELAPKIDWRSLLKSKLNKLTQRVNTFSAPDKRFRSRGMIMPGPKHLDADALENVKVCVDTSGSISPKDLGIALNQIEQLLKVSKAKAELLYWDTRVRAVYEFEKVSELLDKKPLGGGGTSANCIFEYFETERDYKIGRKAKPSVIIVFTDGYFGSVDKKYSKYRDTIWVIAGNDNFKTPFGSVAPFKIDK